MKYRDYTITTTPEKVRIKKQNWMAEFDTDHKWTEGEVREFIDDHIDLLRPIKEYRYTYGEYELIQTEYNWNYIVVDGDGRMLMHAESARKLTEFEAMDTLAWFAKWRKEK